MGQALYRKYRSRSFDEVVGQDHITKTLNASIKTGRISHAYLFTGPRGVGKTSVARILAYEVNGLPYDSEATHLDIIEIDAASNRRIDEIRDLRDKVHITPSSAKYKVYIIDEVHMLTREAFNALLKTLEEPPAHVIFILATTESHKLPETIVSRTQRFNFKAVGQEIAYKHLAEIAKKEKIKIDEPALRLLAEFGDGSFRDSISLLDQLAAGGEAINEEIVRKHLGLPEAEMIDSLFAAAMGSKPAEVLSILNLLRDQAADAASVAKLLADRIRQNIADGKHHEWQIKLLKDLVEVSISEKPFDALEISLLDAASHNVSASIIGDIMPEKPEPGTVEEESTPEPEEEAGQPEDMDGVVKMAAAVGSFDLSMWSEVLSRLKTAAPALYTALRLAVPRIEEDKLSLAFEFPLHQKKVNQAAAREVIAAAIEEMCGAKVIVLAVIDKELVSSAKDEPEAPSLCVAAEEPADNSAVQTISNIFGSAEVLES